MFLEEYLLTFERHLFLSFISTCADSPFHIALNHLPALNQTRHDVHVTETRPFQTSQHPLGSEQQIGCQPCLSPHPHSRFVRVAGVTTRPHFASDLPHHFIRCYFLLFKYADLGNSSYHTPSTFYQCQSRFLKPPVHDCFQRKITGRLGIGLLADGSLL